MSSLHPPFLTKAIYEYKSDYEDDLSFVSGQIIKVTAIEDDEWFSGTYLGSDGVERTGMFPRNFVSEPIVEEAEKPEDKESVSAVTSPKIPETTAAAPPIEHSEELKESSKSLESEPENLKKPTLESQAHVKSDIETPESIRGLSSRISTFDSQRSFPVPSSRTFKTASTSKPYQGNSSYVPPSLGTSSASAPKKFDLSHSSYLPPMLGKNKSTTEKSLPTSHVDVVAENEPVQEEGPKLSLKERIALLQKQQAEEAEKQAALQAKKKKEQASAVQEQTSIADERESLPDAETKSEAEEEESDVDEAIQEHHPVPTQILEGEDETSVEQETPVAAEVVAQGPTTEAAEEEQGDQEENEDDEDEDPEEAKRAALRERMARLAGAGGMFGSAPGGFNPFGIPSAKKTPKKLKAEVQPEIENTNIVHSAPVPVIPFATGAAPEVPKASQHDGFGSEDDNIQDKDVKAPSIESPKPTSVVSYSTANADEAVTEAQDLEWKSQVGIEENISEEEHYLSADEATEALSERLEDVDINSTPNFQSESAIDGDDEGEERDTSEEEFIHIDRQKEIKENALPHVPVAVVSPDAPQIHSDYTTGYESDDDAAPHLESGIAITQSTVKTEKTFKHPPPPPPAGGAPEIPHTTKSAPPPLIASSPEIPPIPQVSALAHAPPVPSAPSIPPSVTSNTSVATLKTSGIPSIPTRASGPPPPVPGAQGSFDSEAPRKSAPLPPPPSEVPSVPGFSAPRIPDIPAPLKTIVDDDGGSINSSIISPTGIAPPIPPIHDDTTKSLKRVSTVESTGSFGSQHARHAPAPSLSTETSHVPSSFAPPVPNEVRRASTFDYAPRQSVSSLKTENQVDLSNGWWLRNNELPPQYQSRVGKDLIFEVDNHMVKRRGGRELVLKDYYILHQDNSQTIIYISYETFSPQDTVSITQKHEPAPAPKKPELQGYSQTFGTQVFQVATSLLNQPLDEPLIPYIFRQLRGILPAVGLRSYGAVIYTNTNNVEVHQEDDFKPGDIIAINKAKFQGHNKLRQKITYEVGNSGVPFAAVITEFDTEKRKFRVIEIDNNGKVKHSSYKPTDMKSGKIKVFRPVGRNYINW